MSKLKPTLIIVVVSVILIAIIFGTYKPVSQTVLSVSQVNIAPQGEFNEEMQEWQGSFWTVLVLTDMSESVGFLKFNDTYTSESNSEIDGKLILPTSQIEVAITPRKPYYKHTLVRNSYMVYPKTYQGWGNKPSLGTLHGKDESVWIDEMQATVYQYGEDYWELHTPFLVEVKKAGKVIFSQEVDTCGALQSIHVENPDDASEWLEIKDLGKIQTGFEAPSTLDDVIFYNGFEYVYDAGALQLLQYDKADNSFSIYWFAQPFDESDPDKHSRWVNEPIKPPACVWMSYNELGQEYVYGVVHAPGVQDVSTIDTWIGKPVPAEPSDVASWIERYYTRKGLDVYGQGYETPDNSELRIYMPYGSVSSLITIMISTELADAVVWEPHIGNIQIQKVTPTNLGQLSDRRNVYINLKQFGGITSTATIKLTPDNLKVDVNPQTLSVTLGPDEEETVKFEAINVGADIQADFKIYIEVLDAFSGKITDSAEVTGTLVPRGTGATSLTVYTVLKESGEPIDGITITVSLGGYQKSLVSVDGFATFDLGGLTGTAYISSAETSKYETATASKDIALGANEVTLEIEEKESLISADNTWLIILAVLIVLALFGGGLFAKRKKLKKWLK